MGSKLRIISSEDTSLSSLTTADQTQPVAADSAYVFIFQEFFQAFMRQTAVFCRLLSDFSPPPTSNLNCLRKEIDVVVSYHKMFIVIFAIKSPQIYQPERRFVCQIDYCRRYLQLHRPYCPLPTPTSPKQKWAEGCKRG